MNKVKTYISTPIEIEAIQFKIGEELDIKEFLGLTDEHKIKNKHIILWRNKNATLELFKQETCILIINTKEGPVTVKNREYIIKDRMGFYNVMREDLFLLNVYDMLFAGEDLIEECYGYSDVYFPAEFFELLKQILNIKLDNNYLFTIR